MNSSVQPPPHAAAGLASDNTKLVELLVASLRQLADAGDIEGACRLAGHACAATRLTDPKAQHRFNALLHRLCKRLGE